LPEEGSEGDVNLGSDELKEVLADGTLELGDSRMAVRKFREFGQDHSLRRLTRTNKAKFYLHSEGVEGKAPLLYPSFPPQFLPIIFQNVHMGR
jgi:hypothetical protein